MKADGLVRAAHGERPPVHAAHHDALDHGLAADLGAARGQGGQDEGDEGEASGHVIGRVVGRAAGTQPRAAAGPSTSSGLYGLPQVILPSGHVP